MSAWGKPSAPYLRVLKGDPHVADVSANVIVTIKNGIVTLHGKVPAEHDR
jgi:hypothetical protein